MDGKFASLIGKGGRILNVSSMSSFMLPQDKVPKQIYRLALADPDQFLDSIKQMPAAVPEEQRTGGAYTMSKSFVVWHTSRKHRRQSLNLIPISPGTYKTPMGEVEGEQAASFALRGALGHLGDPEEIAKMMIFTDNEEYGHLTQ